MKLEALRAAASEGLPGAAEEPERRPAPADVLPQFLPWQEELLKARVARDGMVWPEGAVDAIAVDLAKPGSSDKSVAVMVRKGERPGTFVIVDRFDIDDETLAKIRDAAPISVSVGSRRSGRTEALRGAIHSGGYTTTSELSKEITEAYAKLARDIEVGKLDRYGMPVPGWIHEWAKALHDIGMPDNLKEEIDRMLLRLAEAAKAATLDLSTMTREALMSMATEMDATFDDFHFGYLVLLRNEERAKWRRPSVPPRPGSPASRRPWKRHHIKREFHRKRRSEPLLHRR